MKKILFLLGRYYPKASANSICVQNIIDSLSKKDYQVEVISYDDGFKTNSNIKVEKFNRGIIQSFLYSSERNKKIYRKYINRIIRLYLNFKSILCVPIWPWMDPFITFKELSLVRKSNLINRFDIIVAVHTPFSSLYVANTIKKENPQIKYIAYFLDSLSGGYIPNHINKKWYDRKCQKWERKIIRRADKIVFMNSSKKYHDRLYKGSDIEKNIVYLDLPMLVKRKNKAIANNTNNHIKLVYVGSLSSSIRSPEYILKVFSLIKDSSWELIFVGDSSCELVNEYAKKDSRIKVIGRCSHKKALQYESQATVLINLGNRNPNMAPSKVVEYMSWCKKIVSTYSIKEDTSINYLLGYPDALLLDEMSSIETSANRLVEFAQAQSPKVCYDDLSKKFYNNTPSAFIELL